MLNLGGIIGRSDEKEFNNYTNVHNYGEVEIKDIEFYYICVGGVFGANMSNTKYEQTNILSNVSNNAPITISNVTQTPGHTATAMFRVGGVSAWSQHVMNDCMNNKKGTITVTNATLYNAQADYHNLCVGGVVGYKTVHKTDRCNNYAAVNVNATTTTNATTMAAAGNVRLNVGGCFGWRTDKTGESCENYGDVTVSGKLVGRLCVGGVCGTSLTSTTAVWKNLRNDGKVTIADGTTAQHVTSVGGIFGWTQSAVENATNNGNIYIGSGFTVGYESHFAGMFGYVEKTTTNFKDLTNNGNLEFKKLIYTAATYVGGVFGYAKENADKTSYPGVSNVHQYGKVSMITERPARTIWKDELTSGSTIATGGIAGFLGGLLDDATVHEGADFTYHCNSSTNFTPKNATSADKGNVQWGAIATGLKDYATNCINYGHYTLTGTVGGTFYSGMFCAPYNYSRKNCKNYGNQTINAPVKVNCFPSHGCYDGNANATFVNCENHGDLIIGPKCAVSAQLRAGIFIAKHESASMITVLDGCSNTGDIIVQKGAKVATETRIGLAVGCQNRGILLIRNGYTNSGNIVFSGACNRLFADKPLCLAGILGSSAYNTQAKKSDGSLTPLNDNKASYTITSAKTVGAISYPAGGWTGDVVNTGNITYDGTCVTGVCIGGLFGDVRSDHPNYPVPSGANFKFSGNITATGTFVKDVLEKDATATKPAFNGIGGIYGHTDIAACVAENATINSNISAVGYPNVGMLYGFDRTDAILVKNSKVAGTITRDQEEIENHDGSISYKPIKVTLDGSNFFNYLYSTAITAAVAEGDGVTYGK